jgi:hypothetical protein
MYGECPLSRLKKLTIKVNETHFLYGIGTNPDAKK